MRAAAVTISVLKGEQNQMLLCMDFSGEKVNILCTENKKEKIRVAESLELNVSELGDYLRSKSGKIEEIRVSGYLENTFHKILIMPDMKSKMLKQALETEVIKAFGNDYQFKHQDLGEVPDPGNKVNKNIMTIGIKRNSLEELSQMFAGSRIKPSIVTTYPVALQTLLEKMGLFSEESFAFVEIAHPRSRIVIFKGKEIRVTRELPLAEKEKDTDSSALAKDIYRTLLFYTESFPNQQVAKLAMAGNSSTSEVLENLRQKTGAQIIPFLPETIFPGMKEMPYIYPGCLGLALLEPGGFSFGFVPLSVQEKRKIKKTLILSSSVTLGILLIFALAVSRLSLNLKNLDVYHGGIKGEIKMKEDRLKELGLEFVSHFIETSQPPWSEILLEMAAVVPPGVVFKSFSLKKVKRVWKGEVIGIAEGSDEINSLLMTEKVQNNFVQSPLFKGVKLTEKELRGKQVEFRIIYQLNM
jgi:hypothetical protein